jgi:20S proteasome alpha/beta subunit
MLIGVDFDGTIVEHKYPEIGEERPFATEVLRKFIEDRHKLVLWTMREGKLLEDAINRCKERGVEFYSVNSVSRHFHGKKE